MKRSNFLTLLEALAIRPGAVVALVGGGGKTSTLVRLCIESARDGRRVLATTTTRMKLEELATMEDILLWDEMDATGRTWHSCEPSQCGGRSAWVDDFLAGREHKPLAATFLGRSLMRDKIIGLPTDYLGELLSRLKWDIVVVEADGSRGRSIKGHRLGEPAIPLCSSHCVIVIGADGIEGPMNDDHCHRPEVIQDLLGIAWGASLSPRKVADLLMHPRGLLSKIPGDIDVLVYVNKAPLGRDHAAVEELARELLTRCGNRVRRVAVGDNRQGGLVEAFVPEADESS
jgi:probable selenium-dependent hydroxylase accessory protein YqeC